MIHKHELLNRLAPILRTNDAYLLQGEDLALVCEALKGKGAAEPTVTPEASAPAIERTRGDEVGKDREFR